MSPDISVLQHREWKKLLDILQNPSNEINAAATSLYTGPNIFQKDMSLTESPLNKSG